MTNPLVWISAVLTVAVGQKRFVWWHVSAAGAVLAVVSALFGGVRGYFLPWREVVAQMKAAGFAGASTLGSSPRRVWGLGSGSGTVRCGRWRAHWWAHHVAPRPIRC